MKIAFEIGLYLRNIGGVQVKGGKLFLDLKSNPCFLAAEDAMINTCSSQFRLHTRLKVS